MDWPKLLDCDLAVVQGDCLEVLNAMPSGIVGLTISDPPYESLERWRKIGTTTRLKESAASSNPWFEIFPNTSYWTLLKMLHRCHREDTHCYIFCDSETEHVILSGCNPYDAKLDAALSEYMALHTGGVPPAKWGGWRAWSTLAWVKVKQAKSWKEADELEDDDVHSGMGYHWRRCGERILFLEKGKRKLNELGWKDHLLGPKPGRGDAPAQKPACVIERLLLNSSAPGDLVLDPFAGSGVVGRMALKHGRRAVLIDVTLEWLKWRDWPEADGKRVIAVERPA